MSEVTIVEPDGTETLVAHVCDYCGEEFPVDSHQWYGPFDNREACHNCWESR